MIDNLDDNTRLAFHVRLFERLIIPVPGPPMISLPVISLFSSLCERPRFPFESELVPRSIPVPID
jgi:hypothetical protein